MQWRKRVNNEPRPSDRQMEFLDEHHDEKHELTTTERSAIERYGEPWRHYGAKGSFGKDTDGTFYKAMRAGLHATEGVRRPKWLDDIEAHWPKMGKTKDAHHHTMYGLELAAAGGGFYWRARHKDAELGEEAYNRFRVGVPLTLGCDTESIKEAGLRFEAVEGADAATAGGSNTTWATSRSSRRTRSSRWTSSTTASRARRCASSRPRAVQELGALEQERT